MERMSLPTAAAPVESVLQSASGGTLFVAHGPPTLSQEDIPIYKFLGRLGQMLCRPKAILCISPHWETSEPCLTGTKNPEMLTESGGLMTPAPTKYECPGDPILARRAAECLQVAGMKVTLNHTRGIDRAVWDPLRCMSPEADAPVVQLSVQPAKSAEHHYQVGQALTPLTHEGYLVMGSGLAVHNLKFASANADSEGATPFWAQAFDDWLRTALLEGRYDDVLAFRSKAPFANLAHPTSEHMLPLIVALGAAGRQPKAHAINTGFGFTSISQACFYFQCQSSDCAESNSYAPALGVYGLPIARLVSGHLSKRIPVRRSHTRGKTLAGSRSMQMVVSEAHLEALQKCVLEQSQPESSEYKSPLAKRLETVIASAKRTPDVNSFSRSVSLVPRISGLGNWGFGAANRESTPQENLRHSIQAQRASVEEVLRRGLAAANRRRGGAAHVANLSRRFAGGMSVLGTGFQARPQERALERSASSHQLFVTGEANHSASMHGSGSADATGASMEPLFSSWNAHFGQSSKVQANVQRASQPSDLADTNAPQGCGGAAVDFAFQGQLTRTPSLEKAFSEFEMDSLEASVAQDSGAPGADVHKALTELVGQPQSVSRQPQIGEVLRSKLGQTYEESATKRFTNSADSGWCFGANNNSGSSPGPRLEESIPRALRARADREGESQMPGLKVNRGGHLLQGIHFEGGTLPSDEGSAHAGITWGAQPQGLPQLKQRGMRVESSGNGFLISAPVQSATSSHSLLRREGILERHELMPGLEGSEQLDPATFAQEAAAVAMLGGVSQPDWLWTGDCETSCRQDEVMARVDSDTWNDRFLPATAAHESAADAMLIGMSQPNWSWADSMGL